MRTRRIFIRLLLLAALLLAPLCARAAAVDTVVFSGAAGAADAIGATGATGATDAIGAAGAAIDDIGLWYSRKLNAHCLFLPSCAGDTLTVSFTGADTIQIGDAIYHNNDRVTGLAHGARLALALNGKRYTLMVYRSRGAGAMFIAPDSGSLTFIHKTARNVEGADMLLVNADGETEYAGRLTAFKGRGHDSFGLKKKPYAIKLEKSTGLMGMGRDKSWVLLANYRDNALLRNALTFELARFIGLKYTPDYAFIDLYTAGEYLGSYMLAEKIKVDDDRVDIAPLEKATEALNGDLSAFKRVGKWQYEKGAARAYDIPLDPQDITGGYLLEMDMPDRYETQPSGFVTARGQAVVVRSPEYASIKQMQYISGLFNALERALHAENGADPVTGKHFSEIIDVESFAKKYILEELSRNIDANKSSQYYYKPADAQSLLLHAGPVWDYDNAYANTINSGKELISPRGLTAARGLSYYLFPSAYKQPEFYEAVQTYYRTQVRPGIDILLGDAPARDGLASLDKMAGALRGSADMNFIRWPVFNMAGRKVKTGADYDDNIAYIKDFIRARAAYLDQLWQ